VTKKGRNYGQVCLGPCGEWKPLTEYSRKSKARGGESPFGVIRVCKGCLTAQSTARREAKTAETKKTETKPKRRRAASQKS
jgi:hypothetical protein